MFFTLGLSVLVYSQNNIITTVAGNGYNGFIGDGGPATNAEINVPPGVAADAAGNTYVADQSNHRIRIVNSSGMISTFAGNGIGAYTGDGGQATAAEMYYPWALALDKSGNLYFSDVNYGVVRKIDTAGIITKFAGGGSGGDGGLATNAGLSRPEGIAVDKSGNVYIADIYNENVRIVNTSGIIETFAGGGSLGNGNPATSAILYYPTGVAVDRSGNVYIGEQNGNDVRVVNTSGIILAFAGNGIAGFSGDGGPAIGAEIAEVKGVAVDSSGNVVISHYMGSRIRIVNPSGIINTLAGGGSSLGDGGPATAAQLNGPTGLNFDPTGNLYIADTYNERIRKVSLSTSGINKTKDDGNLFVVYPNPSFGVFAIQTTGLNGISSIEIYNMLGQKVFEEAFSSLQSNNKIDLTDKPAGVYIYRINSKIGNNFYSGKLIIQ